MSDTITIGETEHTIYGSLEDADEHWASTLGGEADAWQASIDADAAALEEDPPETPPEKRKKALVMARRLIDRITWIDSADTFEERDAIENFQLASYEMAGLMLVNPKFYQAETSGKNIKAIYAGDGVGVQFWAPTLGITGRFPVQIQELIGQYLGSASTESISGSWSSGTTAQDSAGGTTSGEGLFDLSQGL